MRVWLDEKKHRSPARSGRPRTAGSRGRKARIVPLSADGVGTMAIQRRTGKGKPTIRRWQVRFMAEGVDGLLHEATRSPGKPPVGRETRRQWRGRPAPPPPS